MLGQDEEVRLVTELNKNPDDEKWEILGYENRTNERFFAIHVVGKKFGKINQERVLPKADIFIAKGFVQESELKKRDFYLNETDVGRFRLIPQAYSGISVKMMSSKNYQIAKISPSTFEKIFGNRELGAGASLYCERVEELKKNDFVIRGWKTSWNKMKKFFKEVENIEKIDGPFLTLDEKQKIFKEIKSLSNAMIKDKIMNNEKISKLIFQGIGNFDEPYTAHWFYEKGVLRKAGIIPFTVTTGSGRSKGIFTVVIKPLSKT